MLIRLMSIRRSRPISMTDLKRPLLAPTVKRSCSFFRSTARVSSNTQSASGAPTWLRPRSLPSATTEAATPPSISANSAASVFNSMVPPLQLALPICAPRRRGGASRSLLNTNKLWVLLGVLWRLGRLPPSPPYGGDLGRKGLGRLKGHPMRWHRAREWRRLSGVANAASLWAAAAPAWCAGFAAAAPSFLVLAQEKRKGASRYRGTARRPILAFFV